MRSMDDHSGLEEPVDEEHPGYDPVTGEVQPPPLGQGVLPRVASRAFTRLKRKKGLS